MHNLYDYKTKIAYILNQVRVEDIFMKLLVNDFQLLSGLLFVSSLNPYKSIFVDALKDNNIRQLVVTIPNDN